MPVSPKGALMPLSSRSRHSSSLDEVRLRKSCRIPLRCAADVICRQVVQKTRLSQKAGPALPGDSRVRAKLPTDGDVARPAESVTRTPKSVPKSYLLSVAMVVPSCSSLHLEGERTQPPSPAP